MDEEFEEVSAAIKFSPWTILMAISSGVQNAANMQLMAQLKDSQLLAPASSPRSVADRLDQVEQLVVEGKITRDEADEMRRRILDSL